MFENKEAFYVKICLRKDRKLLKKKKTLIKCKILINFLNEELTFKTDELKHSENLESGVFDSLWFLFLKIF